jgi:hypothetical protein
MARSRYRSVTYDLEASLDVARAVARVGGHTDTATLAGLLSYSGVRNGAFLSRLANARLFGLVTGRSGEVLVSTRGLSCLVGSPEEAARARMESCLDVPLFRHVLEHYAGQELPPVDSLVRSLHTEFGEPPDKAGAIARTLVASATQAGLIREGRVVLPQARDGFTEFTDTDTEPGRAFVPRVRSRARSFISPTTSRRRVGAGNERRAMATRKAGDRDTDRDLEEHGLWIDGTPAASSRRTTWRRAGILVAVAASLLLVGLPIGLLATSGTPPVSTPRDTHHGASALRLGNGPAERSVLSALSATTDSGSFEFSYTLGESPGTSTTTTTTPCVEVGVGAVSSCGPSTPADNVVQGNGTIDADPIAMAASAAISSDGSSGLQVGVRVDPTTVWEVSPTDNGLVPESNDGSGQPLSQFASLTEGTLGQREGAVAMMGMASPTGYLDLEQPAVSSAAEVGPATVDGVAVTQYELAIDPTALASAAGVSSEEAATIDAALGVLSGQGYTSIHDLVSIDASGFIRESSSTVDFSDGGTVTLDASFSDFGCAGTVLMPGQSGASSPPADCTSPDTGTAPTTTTTTTASPAVTPTTVSSPSGSPADTPTSPTSTSSTSSTTSTTSTTPTESG